MIIGSVSENKGLEKRISITPEVAKKYINLGFEVQLSENYGKHLGFEKKDYSELGVKFVSDDKKIIENSDIIIQMSLLEKEKTSFLKSKQTFIGILNQQFLKESVMILFVMENNCKTKWQSRVVLVMEN